MTHPSPSFGNRFGVPLVVAATVLAVAAAVVVALVFGDADDVPAGVEQHRPVVLGAGTVLPMFDPNVADRAVGERSVSAELQTFAGDEVRLDAGEPTIIVFLAHWCPVCQVEVPALVGWEHDGRIPDGVRVVGVVTSTESSLPNYPPSLWLEREGWPFEVVVDDEDGTFADAYGLSAFPFMVALDDTSTVVWRHAGNMLPAEFDERVAELVTAVAG